MRRRSVLAAGAAGAAALLTGGTKAEAVTTAAPQTIGQAAAGTNPAGYPQAVGSEAALRNLAGKVGLRIGSALVLAVLAAEGETVITSGYYLDRGHAHFAERLTALGADIERLV